MPGSLYYYFDSKEAAFAEVCRRRGEGFNARLTAILSAPGTLTTRVRAGILQHLQHNRPELIATIAFGRRTSPGAPALGGLGRFYERLWQRIFRAAIAARELPREFDCHAATIAVLALCNGAMAWCTTKSPREIERIAARFADYFLNGALPR